ncbi:uncharacterized protein JN550_003618 [Neoarthrinium moseri]|uniref:uncharacterized protein n=1 Tax=Neoarthrinium moseri TaxID=1658444 RepID=UPI001FDAE91F|nr:uncharacterized protein JN550_003618 [Neoarthrinium moseri]KAI1872744.1 hypothetical protein JN550_003618 [Neoarthrinium moseri]
MYWSLHILLVPFLLLIGACQAADVGFALDGAIEGATATDTSFNTGGTISVNGWTATVPKNLQVGFPVAWVPWKDFVASYQAGQFAGYQVSVVGNVVSGKPIAGQVYISQLFTQASSGFIEKINLDGSMKITNGPIIRINDPNAVFSAGYTKSPFMTADDENPSICSFSGFPMCVPRSATDPLCPESNRPTIAATGNKQGTLTVPDPLLMAPFAVGDFIEYSGYRDGSEIIVYEITATNIQIVTGATAANGKPVFIRMEDVNIGVFTADVNAEVAQSKFIGYVSDPAGSPLTVSAIEVDPCTGKETLRAITSANVDTAAGETRNKFDVRLKTGTANDRYTREYMIETSGTGTGTLTKNNITAGRYVQPVTEWIQPELTNPGLAPIPNSFEAFNHLTKGLGPDAAGNIWGPLDPFPQTGVTVFDISSCPPVTTTTPTTSATVTPTATATSTPTTIPVDTVKVTAANWASTGGGTLTVTCTSSNTNATQVGMLLDYTLQKEGTTTFNQVMTAGNNGVWTFSNVKIKQATTVVCHSKLGGKSSPQAVTARRRRRSMAA